MDQLKEILRSRRDSMTPAHATRLHRAISWLQCADKYQEDDDLGFISLWIAFNACYGVEGETEQLSERATFRKFIEQLNAFDHDKKIYHCLWMNYSSFVKAVVDNQFVFAPFWSSQREGNSDWEKPFASSKKLAMKALADGNVSLLLEIVLDRLYVLRNQLMHGGATYQSRVNRDQVKDGGRMLMELLPIIIEIMMDEQDSDWGEIYFPVVQ